MSDRDGSFFLDGLFLGAILGGILGVLFAPQTGEKSRAWLTQVKDDHQDVVDDAMHSSEYMIKAAKDSIEDGVQRVSSIIDQKLSQQTHSSKKK